MVVSRYGLVVVQVLNGSSQAGHPIRGLGGILICRVGALTGRQRLLVGCVGLGIDLRYALLGAGIDIANVASIFRGLII